MIALPELRDQARNKWPGILAHFGVEQGLLTGKQSPCPICGGRDRFRFDNLDGGGTWICNSCGAGDGMRLLQMKKGWEFKAAATEVRRILGEVQPTKPGCRIDADKARKLCRDVWQGSVPIVGTQAEAYLISRGLEGPFPPVLRFHPATPIKDYSSPTLPAMLAIVAGPDGASVNIHRTYLQDGRKAAIEQPRRMMPGLIPDGSAIRLGSAADDLGAAEGIETAMSASHLFRVPVWATINSTMLAKFKPPEGTRTLHIFGDNDAKFGGQAAAYQLAHRVACRADAPAVAMQIPKQAGTDWNDVLALRRMSQAAALLGEFADLIGERT